MEDTMMTKDELLQEVEKLRALDVRQREIISDLKKRAEEVFRRRTNVLGERLKELHCLHGISKLTEQRNMDLDKSIKGIVDLVPPAMEFPGISCARVAIDEKEYRSRNFQTSSISFKREIFANGKEVGILEVFSHADLKEGQESVFSDEKIELINAIASRIGELIESKKTEQETLRRIELEKALQQVSTEFVTEKDFDKVVVNSLQTFGKLTGAKHGCLFLLGQGGSGLECMYGWQEPGAPSADDSAKQMMAELLIRWMDKLSKRYFLHFKNVDDIPEQDKHVRELLQHLNIQSLIILPIKMGGDIAGFIIFENVERASDWDHSDLVLMGFYGEVIGGAFDRKMAEQRNKKLSTAVEQSAEAIIIMDKDGMIEYINSSFETISGFSQDEIVGKSLKEYCIKSHTVDMFDTIWNRLKVGKSWNGRITSTRKDGIQYEEEVSISPIRDDAGEVVNFVSVRRDITHETMLERQLNQARKLESIGQLAAGIAHEINTPIQFVSDNTRFLEEGFTDLMELYEKHNELLEKFETGQVSKEEIEAVKEAAEEADVEFLTEEIPKAIKQSLEGIERVAKIVRAMKEFSHPGVREKSAADINKAIQSTITVSRNEWKYVADMVTDLDDNLPLVPCFVADLNQVVLNMIINASHAIADKIDPDKGEKGTITIRTRLVDQWAEIRIEDTGGGIPEAIRERIFDPFFTTKEVGKGTGQGLAISYSVIVDKHGGQIDIESEEGVGTTFILRLPLTDPMKDDGGEEENDAETSESVDETVEKEVETSINE